MISRTSVMRYGRGERQDLRSIANTLGVTNVVEGTVTRVGQRVRIKTDLVDATRDQTIWSETYDRDLTDIFSIQSDVAERVASALRGKLSRDEQATIRQIPTQNLAAYDFYLRGWALYQLYRQEDNEKAIDLFKQALALDPKFALSYSGLASAYVERVARFHGEKSWIDSAIHLCRQAIALDPKEVRGYTELAKALLFKDLGEEAREPIRKALELDPNDWRARTFSLPTSWPGDDVTTNATRISENPLPSTRPTRMLQTRWHTSALLQATTIGQKNGSSGPSTWRPTRNDT